MFPTGWPPRPASGIRSARFFQTGTTSSNFSDNAFLFSSPPNAVTVVPLPEVPPGGVNTVVTVGDLTAGGSPMGGGRGPDANLSAPVGSQAVPVPMSWAYTIVVFNDGAGDILVSFDGVNTHAIVKSNNSREWEHRFEAGISLKDSMGVGYAFRIEAW